MYGSCVVPITSPCSGQPEGVECAKEAYQKQEGQTQKSYETAINDTIDCLKKKASPDVRHEHVRRPGHGHGHGHGHVRHG